MHERIVVDPKVQHGKPVIRGTRVTVACIVSGFAGGMTLEQVQTDYDVSVEDIRAALEYAAGLVEQEEHHPLPA